jgi:hypothetical protein
VRVRVERIGTNGDMARAARLFRELDGEVDALGVGGADLGLRVAGTWYPLRSVQRMVRGVRRTPVVDGTALRNTLERRVAAFLEERLGARITPRRVLLTMGAERWGMTRAFLDAGYACVFGDLMFGLDLPLPLRSERVVRRLAALMLPVAGRLPFTWIYPTGERQEEWRPKRERWFRWATVVAGDCLFIRRHMPATLAGKIICTNSTTPGDVERFRAAGVCGLVTTTPLLDGRTFGTNVLEAALVAVSGRGRVLADDEVSALVDAAGLQPTVRMLERGD